MIKYKFCPQCKTKLDLTGEYPYCSNCDLTIYLNSKPTASILLIDGDKVLLGKRAINPFKDEYDIIGGFLKNGEDPVTGVLREAKEETGLTVKITNLLGIYMDIYGKGGDYTLNIYYIGKIINGEMKASDDVAELEWFEIEDLPKPAFKNQEEVFKDLQKWYFSRGAEN